MLLSTSFRKVAHFSTIKKVGVCGVGLLGHGIAQVSAETGHSVALYDNDEAGLQRGLKMIEQSLKKVAERKVKKGDFDQKSADDYVAKTLSRIETKTTDLNTLAGSGCDLIIEAIVEKFEIKKSLYQTLGKDTPKETILASNTSSLSITSLAEASGRKDRTIGLHFFNPVQMMPLVEVISLKSTDSQVTDSVMQYVGKIKKTPVKCGDTPGFIVNRLLVPYLAEAMEMVDRRDAEVEAIDVAMKLG